MRNTARVLLLLTLYASGNGCGPAPVGSNRPAAGDQVSSTPAVDFAPGREGCGYQDRWYSSSEAFELNGRLCGCYRGRLECVDLAHAGCFWNGQWRLPGGEVLEAGQHCACTQRQWACRRVEISDGIERIYKLSPSPSFRWGTSELDSEAVDSIARIAAKARERKGTLHVTIRVGVGEAPNVAALGAERSNVLRGLFASHGVADEVLSVKVVEVEGIGPVVDVVLQVSPARSPLAPAP